MPSAPYPLESLFGRILNPFDRFLRRTTAETPSPVTIVTADALDSWLGSQFAGREAPC